MGYNNARKPSANLTAQNNLMDDFFLCPCCGQENSIFIDLSAGSRQKLLLDCENCCRPLVVTLKLTAGEIVSIDVAAENE